MLKSVSRKGRQGRLQVQGPGGAVLLLRRRPDADRAAAHLVEGRSAGPGQVQGRRTRSAAARTRWARASPQNITYAKNPHYWQPGMPKIDKVYYPAYTVERPGEPGPGDRQGAVGRPVHPEHQRRTTSPRARTTTTGSRRSPTSSIFINLKNPILKNVAVRQAMAYAIDRAKVSKIGEYGYEPAAQPDRDRDARRSRAGSNKKLAKKFTLQPGEGEADPDEGRLQADERLLPDEVRQAAVVHDDQHRRLLRLGRLGAGRPAELKAIGIKLTRRTSPSTTYDDDVYNGQVRPRVRRERGRRAGAVLRAAPGALLEELRADRPVGVVELGAVLQPEGRQR